MPKPREKLRRIKGGKERSARENIETNERMEPETVVCLILMFLALEEEERRINRQRRRRLFYLRLRADRAEVNLLFEPTEMLLYVISSI